MTFKFYGFVFSCIFVSFLIFCYWSRFLLPPLSYIQTKFFSSEMGFLDLKRICARKLEKHIRRRFEKSIFQLLFWQVYYLIQFSCKLFFVLSTFLFLCNKWRCGKLDFLVFFLKGIGFLDLKLKSLKFLWEFLTVGNGMELIF